MEPRCVRERSGLGAGFPQPDNPGCGRGGGPSPDILDEEVSRVGITADLQ